MGDSCLSEENVLELPSARASATLGMHWTHRVAALGTEGQCLRLVICTFSAHSGGIHVEKGTYSGHISFPCARSTPHPLKNN